MPRRRSKRWPRTGTRSTTRPRFRCRPIFWRGRLLSCRTSGSPGRDALARDAAQEEFGEVDRDVVRLAPAVGLHPEVRVVVHAEPRERGELRIDIAELAGFDPGAQNHFDDAFVFAATNA